MIGTFAIFFVKIITERLIRGHARQLKSFHQTVHPTDTDVNAIITLKNTGNFVSTKMLVVISINLQNTWLSADFLWCGQLVVNCNACNKYFC